jgi:hypothetical protein
VVDLWSIERLYWIFSAPASVTFASDPAIDSINADIGKSGEPGRVLALRAGPGVDPTDPALGGSELMAHGIRVVAGYHGNELAMYRELLLADSGQIQLRPEFWKHENVRYIYTAVDEPSFAQATKQMGIPPVVKLAGPVRNAGGSMVYAYRIPTDNPAAWVAGSAVSAPPNQVLPTVLDPRFDPTRAALIDTGASIPTRNLSLAVSTPLTAHVSNYQSGRLSIDLSAPATNGAVLVVSENYFPGWQGSSGGTALPTSRANYNLIGVALSPGIKHVDLTFTDAAYLRGKRMTLIALLIAVAGLIGGLVLGRREPASPAPIG